MNKTSVFFVTGTDTEVGKTFVSAALLSAAQQQGMSTLGLKPVAAGCEETLEGLRNEDAQILQAFSSLQVPYDLVNPVAVAPPIAPHIALAREKRIVEARDLAEHCLEVVAGHKADFVLVEGAGGWLVPLNDSQTLADVAIAMQVPVILVVGVRLGCINHGLLSAAAIESAGLPLAGWVANTGLCETAEVTAVIESLEQRMPAPCLGVLPRLDSPEKASKFLSLNALLGGN